MTPPVRRTGENGTGPARSRRPQYVSLLPPCNHACPAGEQPQAWLDHAQAGRYRAAWTVIVRDNPLPAVHGRVCYHPCESACNRGELDAALSIHAVERFIGDLALEQGWDLPVDAPARGRRVLVIGAGPAGLSAAWQLRRLGHTVEIHEAADEPGGLMRYGIPAYRLPREVLQGEISRLLRSGIQLRCGTRVDDLERSQREGGFEAVFIAIGAGLGKHLHIPARDAGRVFDAVNLLHAVSAGATPPQLGRRVIVYGGGNTAMDAARTVRRLGVDEAMVVYRRDRAHMPAHAFEAEEAEAEGVHMHWLSTVHEIGAGQIEIEHMRLDAAGQPQPTGEFETLPADALVLALGQSTDSEFLARVPGIERDAHQAIKVGADLMTGHPGIFAGGDAVPGEQSVTLCVGHGKWAARQIDAWLNARVLPGEATAPLVRFDMLHLPVYSDAEPRPQPSRPLAERLGGFTEIIGGLDEAAARYEAQRCLSCGNCFECDQCYAACPEQAIVKLGPGQRYRIDLERCTGCAVCVAQCPCHALETVPEPAATQRPRP